MSGAVPPPAARPLGRGARVPRRVSPGSGRCRRGDPARAPRRAPLRAGVVRRGGGGEASPGGGAVRRCEGRLGSGAPPPPAARPLGGLLGPLPTCCGPGCAGAGALHRPRGPRALWGAARHVGGGGRLGSGAPSTLLPALWAGCRGPLATCCGRGCGFLRCVWCLCGACRGAALLLSLWCSPLWCLVAVWCPPCAVCLPCSLPCARPYLGCWLPLVSFVASSLFTLSSARPSSWHALFPCLRPGVCLCVFFRWLVFLSLCAL